MGSAEVAIHASTTEAGNTASNETADTASADGTNMGPADATDMASAEAANMASAETATVTTAPTAATRLRVGCKQAAGQRRGHQDSHYPSQHEFSFLCAAAYPPRVCRADQAFSTETDRTPGQDLVRVVVGIFGFLSLLTCSCANR
jgi:hypothetical protein